MRGQHTVGTSVVHIPASSRQYIPNIPLTAREIRLRFSKDHDAWDEDTLTAYLIECRRFGIAWIDIGMQIKRSATWTMNRATTLGISTSTPRKPKPEPQSKARKPSAPKRYV